MFIHFCPIGVINMFPGQGTMLGGVKGLKAPPIPGSLTWSGIELSMDKKYFSILDNSNTKLHPNFFFCCNDNLLFIFFPLKSLKYFI